MPTYLHPGVYVEEIPSGARPIEGVGTSTAAFVGYATKGPMAEPTLIFKWDAYDDQFGGLRDTGKSPQGDPMGFAVYNFFLNGGTAAYIVRLVRNGTADAAAGFLLNPGDAGQIIQFAAANPATEGDMQQLNKVLGAKWPRFPYKLDFDMGELPALMSQSYSSPVWTELSQICLACGQCTLVCPTCYCFNIYDEVDLHLVDGERHRRWGSCQLDEFASVAGGENFREHQATRLRHRFMRKGRYLMEKFGELGCVGCGRCARSCLVDISPASVFNDLRRARM